MRVVELCGDREDDDVARLGDAVAVELRQRGQELRAGLGRVRREEVPGLAVHRRGREAQDLKKRGHLLARNLAAAVVLRRVALLGEAEKDVLFHCFVLLLVVCK